MHSGGSVRRGKDDNDSILLPSRLPRPAAACSRSRAVLLGARQRGRATAGRESTLAEGRGSMIAAVRQACPFRRSPQRLADVELAFDRGHYTSAVLLICTAVDTSQFEAFSGNCRRGVFLYSLFSAAGGSARRIKGFYRKMNLVVHGYRNARRRDAQQMLRMFRSIGRR